MMVFGYGGRIIATDMIRKQVYEGFSQNISTDY